MATQAVKRIMWPEGAADEQAVAYAANPVVSITNMMTILTFAILTGDSELDLDIDSEVKDGAQLLLIVPATANADDLTLGDGIQGPVIVGVAGKTKTQKFTLSNGVFYPDGAIVQID